MVFLTATVLKEDLAKQGGTIGGHPFIPKPFRAEVLLERIEKMLPPEPGAVVCRPLSGAAGSRATPTTCATPKCFAARTAIPHGAGKSRRIEFADRAVQLAEDFDFKISPGRW